MTTARITWTVFRIVAGLGLLAYVLSGSGWEAVRSISLPAPIVLMVVGLPFAGALVEVIRLQILYRAQGLRLPFGLGFRVVVISVMFNFCIPGATGGDVIKIWYLNAIAQRGAPEVAAIWFVDRLTGLFSLLLLVVTIGLVNLPFVLSFPVLRWLLGAAVIATAGVILAVLISRTRVMSLAVDAFARLPRAQQVARRMVSAVVQFHDRPGAMGLSVLVSLAGHLALLTTFVAVGSVLIPALPVGNLSLLTLFGLFANAAPITPGGLGVGEAAFNALFGLAGVAGGARLLLIWRLGMMPLCIAGGLFYIVGIRHRPAARLDRSSGDAAVAIR
jgi:glycosyltransferase 2 family protein